MHSCSSVADFSSIAIVGSGAIGLYYGTRLGRAGNDVRFLMRGDLAAVRARGSLSIQLSEETIELRPVQAFASTSEIGAVEVVIVTLKTTANAELARLLPPLLGPTTAILTLQNGLGADEHLAALFGAGRVMGGLAFIATTRTGPGQVKCFHPGSLTIGEFQRPASERARAIAARFEAAGVTTRVAEDLASARWHKLVWNIPFNGLAVAENCTTDQICADARLASEARALMSEVQRAANALGFRITDEFVRQQFDVTPPMGAYQPSSLVDFRAGRELELEAIWGEPLRRALAARVAVPRLAELYRRLEPLARPS